AKDKLWYPSMYEIVQANIKFNENYLKKLGLDKFQKSGKKKRSSPKKRKSTSPSGPTRESKRIRKAPPELGDQQTSLRALENVEKPESKIHRRTIPKQYKTLSSKELEQLKLHFDKGKNDDEQWIDEMDEWMRTVPHGTGNQKTVSDKNAKTVMRQVRKLVVDARVGKGIDYPHWSSNVSFCWWKPVPPHPEEDDGSPKPKGNHKPGQHILTCDLQDIYNLAQEMEDTHGKDLGNGWLLLHPIRKLQLFQEHYYRKTKATAYQM
ncbi:MAG: hypothetical protein SGILL_006900, partial [Bacillariaceae sp.]